MLVASLSELNMENQRFWHEQSELAKHRLSSDSIRKEAFEKLKTEQIRGIPIRFQTTLEQALESAEKTQLEHAKKFRSAALKEQASKGGKAAKADALQRLISEAVQERPHLTLGDLVQHLKGFEGAGVIYEITTDCITFNNYRDGRTKDAPLRGLKDRLLRAKKINRSR